MSSKKKRTTTRTTRKCPWCGESVHLARAPIVATNVHGGDADRDGGAVGTVGGLGGGEFAWDEDFTIDRFEDLDEPEEATQTTAERQSAARRALPVSGAPVLGYAGELPIVAASQVAPESAYGVVARMRRKRLVPLRDVADSRDLPARACTACHHPLPADIDERDVLIVSVLGINRAGKTYLLATALNEALNNGALEPAGIAGFNAEAATANRVHRDYYLPVFRKRSRLDATQDPAEGDSAEPMIFRFEIGGTPYLLALHDIAGEAIAEPRRRAVIAPFVSSSDAMLFVVDPLEIDSVRTRLPFEQITVDWRGWSQADVMRACVEALGPDAATTPVSVVLTKSDLIGLAEKRRFRFDRPAPATGWLEDQAEVDEEVRGLLKSWGAAQLEDIADQAVRGTFHAVSAFGSAPSDPASPGVVQPLRVADPLGTLIRRIAEARGPQ